MSSHHIVPLRFYYKIFAALIVLTVVTVGIDAAERATLHNNEGFMPATVHTALSMGIAVVKASLVMLFFMHIWYSPWLNWLVAGGSLLWLAILLVYTLTDYASRNWMHVPGH